MIESFTPSLYFTEDGLYERLLASVYMDDLSAVAPDLITHVAEHTPADQIVVSDDLSMSEMDIQPDQFTTNIITTEAELWSGIDGPDVAIHGQAAYSDTTQVKIEALNGPGLHAPTQGPSQGRMVDVGIGIGFDAIVDQHSVTADSYIVVSPE